MFVVTAHESGASFSITVDDVHEKQDCMDEEEAKANPVLPPADTDCGQCGVTRFLYDLVFN